MTVPGITGPDRLRLSLRRAVTRGTGWLAHVAAPITSVGTPIPAALLGGQLAELAGERLRALLRGEPQSGVQESGAPRGGAVRTVRESSWARARLTSAPSTGERGDTHQQASTADGDDRDVRASFAPPVDLPRPQAPLRAGSLPAAVRGYWAARAVEAPAASRPDAALPRTAASRSVRDDMPVPPEGSGAAGDAAGFAGPPAAVTTVTARPLPPAPAAGPAPAVLRARAADVHVPAPRHTRAAATVLPEAFDDSLADAIADLLREQALRDGITLAW